MNMEVENKRIVHNNLLTPTGNDILEALRKPKVHRRPNRPKSAHHKVLSSRPKSAHPGGRNSRAKEEILDDRIESEDFITSNVADDRSGLQMRLERPQTARPPTRMSHRYEEVFVDDDDDDLNVDPVEFFNRPVSRIEGNIHKQIESEKVRGNHDNVNDNDVLKDDEEYYMNMDPVEYFADPNIKDIFAIVKPEEKVSISHKSRDLGIDRKFRDLNANVTVDNFMNKDRPHAHIETGNGFRGNSFQNMTTNDIYPSKRKSENKAVSYQLKEQNSLGVKHDKLLKSRTNLRATNQFASSYGNLQNNSQYHTKVNGYAGALKARPTSLIEQTDTPFNQIRYAAGVHVGNKGRDRLISDSVILQNANKMRPYSEDRKLILPENRLNEFSSNPAERVLARYTKGLSIDERKPTRSKSNKDTFDQAKKVSNRHGLNTNGRTVHNPRKLKPLAFNFEHVTF